MFFYKPNGDIHRDILLLDTCASYHCTGNKSILHNYEDEEDKNAELTGLDIENSSRIIRHNTIF
ncbi:hypothetical protein HK096_006976, partial [Nowakowskiella sp. JEL0078]